METTEYSCRPMPHLYYVNDLLNVRQGRRRRIKQFRAMLTRTVQDNGCEVEKDLPNNSEN